MKNKLILALMLGMFLISFAGASPGTYKQGQKINLLQTCADCTYVNISSITSPNGSILISNAVMSQDGSVFNYTLNSSFTDTIGTYRVNGIGDPEGTDEIWTYGFDVTYYGYAMSQSQSILYIALFGIIIFAFVITLFGINKLPKYNQTDEEGRILSITYLKYLRPALWFFEWMLFIAILFLSSNLAFAYLNEQMFAQILFVLFKICFALSPVIVIVWMIWIYVKMFHDRQFQKLLNRGIFPQGKLP